MKKYKVKYTLTTHSRCGSYVYRQSETVEADTEQEAVDKVRSSIKQRNGHYRFTLKGVAEV